VAAGQAELANICATLTLQAASPWLESRIIQPA